MRADTLSFEELRKAFEAQVAYTGEQQHEIDRLKVKCQDYQDEIAIREEREAELESTVRAIRKLVR